MTEERVRLTLRIPARIVHAIEESGEKVSPTIQRIIEEHYLSYVMIEHVKEEPVRNEPKSEMAMVCEAVQESGIDLFAAQDAGAFTSEQIDKIESIVSSKGILMSRRILVNYLERILE